ncbi:hydroxyacid dehydrogenase [Brevundimonas staleyi]|uniref:hydroxyacid dehydrogenase n=1 Tax=Brevundimonas staleyi TaxID=74326 RepID=UPI0035A73025
MWNALIAGPDLPAATTALAAQRGLTLTPLKAYASPDEMIAAANAIQADAIVVRMGRITPEVIDGIPSLKVIAKNGVGVDGIDLAAASARGIPVLIAGGANAQSVAEHALALLMSVARSTAYLDARMRQGHWDKGTHTGYELRGKSLGVIGLGNIGRAFLDLLAPFRMTVQLHDPFMADADMPEGVSRAESVDALLSASDIVSLHCPLTDQTRGMISAQRLSRMKPHALLINTARGELIDQTALIDALQSGRIGGAGLDTFSPEPPAADSLLWTLPNLVATPHIGANTHDAKARMGESVVQQIADYLESRSLDRRNLANAESIAA